MIAGADRHALRPPQLQPGDAAHPRPLLRGRGTPWRSLRRSFVTGGTSPSRPTAWSFTGTGRKKRLAASTAPSPPTCSPPPSQTGPSASPTSTHHTDWDQEDKRVEHAFLTHCTRYLAEGGLLVFIVPRQTAGGVGPLPVHPLPEPALLGLPRPGNARCSTKLCCFGYRKADPIPDASAEETVNRWSGGRPRTAGRGALPLLQGKGDPGWRHPVHHPDRRSRRCGYGGQADGAVGQRGDNRLPLARKGQPHPTH